MKTQLELTVPMEEIKRAQKVHEHSDLLALKKNAMMGSYCRKKACRIEECNKGQHMMLVVFSIWKVSQKRSLFKKVTQRFTPGRDRLK